ncbi:ABC transporter ATP-binding protein, partial [Burkholderia cenocepacia]
MMKDSANAIEVSNVSKIYRSYSSPRHRLLELMAAGRKQYFRETRALDDVSFTLEKGGRFGIVGENGSGKSTLLKVLAGVLNPSMGSVNVSGRVSALLELGAGFNPELTGRENIIQFCMLHGMHYEQALEAQPEIIRFSELGDAVSHPVKTYSSGMSVRLGFACAVYVQPDILIVDEALSVGDAYFQNKCLHKIRTMLDQGTTFIYVTHAADSIRSLCTRGLWLEKGRVRLLGASTEVGAAYQSEVFSRMVRAGIGAETLAADTEDHTEVAGTGRG